MYFTCLLGPAWNKRFPIQQQDMHYKLPCLPGEDSETEKGKLSL